MEVRLCVLLIAVVMLRGDKAARKREQEEGEGAHGCSEDEGEDGSLGECRGLVGGERVREAMTAPLLSFSEQSE